MRGWMSLVLMSLLGSVAFAEDEWIVSPGEFDEKRFCSSERSEAEMRDRTLETNRQQKTKYVGQLEKVAAAAHARLDECVAAERAKHDAAVAEYDKRVKEIDDREAARDARIKAEIADRPTVRAAISAWICVEDAVRSRVLAEIKTEKKYSKVSGAQNNAKLYELQQMLRTADTNKAKRKADLKALKLAPLGCKVPQVKRAAFCVMDHSDEGFDESCFDGELLAPVVELADFFDDTARAPD